MYGDSNDRDAGTYFNKIYGGNSLRVARLYVLVVLSKDCGDVGQVYSPNDFEFPQKEYDWME